MSIRSLLRDLALVCFALAVGWWCRGAGDPVHAQYSSNTHDTTSEPTLSFQLSPINRDTALSIYNPSNHTLYVYPAVQTGNSYVNCEFSFRIGKPGEPIQRQNCPVGQTYPH